jgi:hypothetical protein
MNLVTVIDQVRTYCPALGGRVSGAADFAAGLESTVNLALPSAFILRLEDAVTDNDQQPGLQQLVTERMGVVVEFDNTTNGDADRRTGFAGTNQTDDMRGALWAALLTWLPPELTGRARQGFSYGGGHLLDFDRARLFWQFEFTLELTLTDADGFPLRGDPLRDAQGTITVAVNAPAVPVITFDVLVPP